MVLIWRSNKYFESLLVDILTIMQLLMIGLVVLRTIIINNLLKFYDIITVSLVIHRRYLSTTAIVFLIAFLCFIN